MNRLPWTKSLGQVPPRDTRAIAVKNGFHEQAIVFGRYTHMAFTARQQTFDPLPIDRHAAHSDASVSSESADLL